MDYYDRYPQTDLEIYFGAAVSETVNRSLLNALKPQIEGKTEVEAVDWLLRFIQESFVYKTDDEQFGREKFFFPDEPFYYDYCDCEDRSVLFAYLVQNLTGLDVVGLDYPGHVAAAVQFKDDLPGDYIVHGGNKYIICDPTFIGARVGMCMPQFINLEPKVIPARPS
jgi:hypothetical protein